MTDSEMSTLKEAARKAGKTFSAWAIDTLIEVAKKGK